MTGSQSPPRDARLSLRHARLKCTRRRDCYGFALRERNALPLAFADGVGPWRAFAVSGLPRVGFGLAGGVPPGGGGVLVGCSVGGVCLGWWFLSWLALLFCGVVVGAWSPSCFVRWFFVPVGFGVFGSFVACAWLRFGVLVVGFRGSVSFVARWCSLVGCAVGVASRWFCRSARLGVFGLGVAVPFGFACGLACGLVPVVVGGVLVGSCGAFPRLVGFWLSCPSASVGGFLVGEALGRPRPIFRGNHDRFPEWKNERYQKKRGKGQIREEKLPRDEATGKMPRKVSRE